MQQPNDLAEWSLHCFCLGARKTPHAIVRSGRNGRLLFEASDWIALADLEKNGLGPSEEALGELTEFRILERRPGMVRARVPRYGPDKILPVRNKMRAAAAAYLVDTRPGIEELAGELAENGLSHAFYAVFFGTVMDGLLWGHLRNRVEIPETWLNAEFPLWRGVFWAVYPRVEDAIGTNDIHHDDATLTLVWSEKTARRLNEMRRQEWTGHFMNFLVTGAIEPPPQAISAGLVDGAGNVTIPVFGRNALADAWQAADRIAERAAIYMGDMLGNLGFGDDLSPPDRNIILAHEAIWAVQTAFREGGTGMLGRIVDVRPPTDLKGSVVARIALPDDQSAMSG